MAFVEKRGAGRWRARYRGPDGRERNQTFSRKVDAERFLVQVEHDKQRGTWVDPELGKTTLAEYVDQWLPSTAHLAAGTYANIDGRLRNHLLPYFGDLPWARSVRRTSVDGWPRWSAKAWRLGRSGRPMGRSRVCCGPLRSMGSSRGHR
jgi:hypothetical protein